MNRAEIFFDAITNIREELVEEAQEFVFRGRRTAWRRYAAMAACLTVAVTLFLGVYQLAQIGRDDIVSTDAAPPASGGSQNQNTSGGAAPQVPEATPGDSNEYSGNNAGGADHGLHPSPMLRSFHAIVLEIYGDTLLVEPMSDQDTGVERVEVSTSGLENLPELQEGDLVTVYCAEILMQDGSAAAMDVAAILLAEPLPSNP